jgi:hypothetical protein
MKLHASLTIASVLALAAPAVAGEIFFYGNVPYSYAEDISADGKVVSGGDQRGVWYWTKDTWVVRLADSLAYGNGVGGVPSLTADGRFETCSTLQGATTPQKSEATLYDITQAIYTPGGNLGANCDIERCGAWGMNPDGKWTCGLMWYGFCAAKGYVWQQSTAQFTLLEPRYFYKPTRANGISDDGTVVAGWNDDYNGWRQGCAWKRDATGYYAPSLIAAGASTNKTREAQCVSGDGKWVYGAGGSTGGNAAPYRFSFTQGFQAITPVPEAGNGFVHRANYDGSMLAVSFGQNYVWTADRGYVLLQTWAHEHGFEMPTEWSYVLFNMSRDGLSFCGYALRSDGVWSPWSMDLHPGVGPCVGDLNGDHVTDGADLGVLLGDWGLNTQSDRNGDHVVDGADLGILLGAWGNCP